MTKDKSKAYSDAMHVFFEELDKMISTEARAKQSISNDVDRALLGLWRIISYNVFTVIDDFADKKKFYAASGCTRVVMECTADARYLSYHSDEAAQYWQNQDKIREDLKKRKNRWDAFVEGSVNKHGQLRNRTLKRIEDALGKDGIGAYNFLCFYSHPNTAAMFWLLDDKSGATVKYVVQIMTQMIDSYIELLDESSSFDIDSAKWTRKLGEVYKKLDVGRSELTI